ncbi:hypothetical protein DL98DRAFT_8132 [Cadophora sp. DSE1049]|nr:hypothetical protein DL98DRAFT_8132 [Cadophora sp. DSE1049]
MATARKKVATEVVLKQPTRAPELIIIAPKGDLILNLYTIVDPDKPKKFIGQTGTLLTGTIVVKMQVSRQVLEWSTPKFRNLLKGTEAHKIVDMHFNTNSPHRVFSSSFETLLRVLHNTLIHLSYNRTNEAIWEILHQCKEFDIKCTQQLTDWFKRVAQGMALSSLDLLKARELLTPAYEFNTMIAFAILTKRLAYEWGGHITEKSPITSYRTIHLEGNVIAAVNSAGGSLRRLLTDLVMNPGVILLEKHTCVCREKAYFNHHDALKQAGLYPLWVRNDSEWAPKGNKSIKSVVTSTRFRSFYCKAPKAACVDCIRVIKSDEISKAKDVVEADFQGLCLDCMRKTKTGDIHEDYWRHAFIGTFAKGCTFRHGSTTWYYSFMGRNKGDLHEFTRARNNLMKDMKTKTGKDYKPTEEDWEIFRPTLKITGLPLGPKLIGN